jgi:hypothetical protein
MHLRDLGLLVIHLVVTLARSFRPGGVRSIVAESLLVKHQLLILNRSRKRAPDLRPTDRVIAGLGIALQTEVGIGRAVLAYFARTHQRQSLERRPLPLRIADFEITLGHGRVGPTYPTHHRFATHAGALDGPAVCRLFGSTIRSSTLPAYLSSDNDPLFEFHRWKANLRILDIIEVKTIAHSLLIKCLQNNTK